MTPDISDFILGSLVETDKYTKVPDENFFAAKQTGKFQIEICDRNGKPFIALLYNMILVPDLCDRLFPLLC